MSIRGQQQHQGIQSFAFLMGICLCIVGHSWLAWGHGGDEVSGVIALSGRLNPNEAPVASLMRLPGIGAVRAAAIVAYREQFSRQDDGRRPFYRCDDLQKIKGIGPKTVEKIRDYLEFDQIVHTD